MYKERTEEQINGARARMKGGEGGREGGREGILATSLLYFLVFVSTDNKSRSSSMLSRRLCLSPATFLLLPRPNGVMETLMRQEAWLVCNCECDPFFSVCFNGLQKTSFSCINCI